MTVRWTREAVEELGPTTDVPTTARILGVDPDTVYEAIRSGQWDITRVLRIGRRVLIPTVDLLRTLYDPAPAPHPSEPSVCHQQETEQVTGQEPHTSCGCRAPDQEVVHPFRRAT